MRSNICSNSQKTFTLIELLIVISIISLLFAMLFSALSMAKEKAIAILCGNNQTQIYKAVAMYAIDWKDWLPMHYDIKKKVLSEQDIKDGRRLNTIEEGNQTILLPYTNCIKVFHDPGDKGSAEDPTPVWTLCGASIELKGFTLKDVNNNSKTNFWSKMDSKAVIVSDIFKPWEAEDPAKVASKIAKGERGPIKYHGRIFVEVLGAGNLVNVKSKAEDDAAQGK